MASKKFSIFAITAALLCISVWLHAGMEQVTDQTRTIANRPGVSLKTRLLPNDRIVLVTREVHGIRSVEEPTLPQEVTYAAGMSEAVILADMSEEPSVLTEDESWIHTPLTFRTVEVVVPKDRRFRKRQRLYGTAVGSSLLMVSPFAPGCFGRVRHRANGICCFSELIRKTVGITSRECRSRLKTIAR